MRRLLFLWPRWHSNDDERRSQKQARTERNNKQEKQCSNASACKSQNPERQSVAEKSDTREENERN